MFGGLFVVCHLSKHFSAVHSIVIVWAGYIRLLFKLPLKFRNVLQHTESRSTVACNQNIKEDIFTELEVLLCFEMKRNNINVTDPPRKHPRNARVISAKELGTMSRNNLRQITLVRGPIWGIHSLTLIISWLSKMIKREFKGKYGHNAEENVNRERYILLSKSRYCIDSFSLSTPIFNTTLDWKKNLKIDVVTRVQVKQNLVILQRTTKKCTKLKSSLKPLYRSLIKPLV